MIRINYVLVFQVCTYSLSIFDLIFPFFLFCSHKKLFITVSTLFWTIFSFICSLTFIQVYLFINIYLRTAIIINSICYTSYLNRCYHYTCTKVVVSFKQWYPPKIFNFIQKLTDKQRLKSYFFNSRNSVFFQANIYKTAFVETLILQYLIKNWVFHLTGTAWNNIMQDLNRN